MIHLFLLDKSNSKMTSNVFFFMLSFTDIYWQTNASQVSASNLTHCLHILSPS